LCTAIAAMQQTAFHLRSIDFTMRHRQQRTEH
jgi:hypothetical protein